MDALGSRVEEASERITQTSEMNTALSATITQQRTATAEISRSVQSIAEKAAKTRIEVDNITKRLTKAESLAQTALGDASGLDHYELVRLQADLGLWKRQLATILLGSVKADPSAADLRGRAARRIVEALRSSPAHGKSAEAFLKAEATAHEQAERMIQAIAQSNWEIGTPAYQAASAAIKDMIKAAAEILDAE